MHRPQANAKEKTHQTGVCRICGCMEYKRCRYLQSGKPLWIRPFGRKMVRRLGLRSHAHCWRVARNYRTGQIPMVPSDEEGLMELRESLDKPPIGGKQFQHLPSG